MEVLGDMLKQNTPMQDEAASRTAAAQGKAIAALRQAGSNA
jgi:hypothetical protein